MRNSAWRRSQWLKLISVSICLGSNAMLASSGLAQGTLAPERRNVYCEPPVLTGTIYPKDSQSRTALFTFRRAATCEGDTVRVLREYRCPDGTVAAREKVVYQANRLVGYEMEDLRADETGRAVRGTNAMGKPDVLQLQYGQGKTKRNTRDEAFPADTLINDMLPAFLMAHWNELIRGSKVKFRFVALSRLETVGFSVKKESEAKFAGSNVVRLRMEPTSIVIAQLVEPIFFVAEKEGEHRILQYTGRTTPRVKSGNNWKDLDAVTVFDWK